jgi:CBS domain-containing protein
MLVEDVLKSKGRKVETIEVEAELNSALDKFSELPVRALMVVDENGRLAGVLTVRDALRQVRRTGADALHQPVRHAMTCNVFSVAPDSKLEEVEKLVARRTFSHVPVLSEGKLVGVVTLADLLRRHLDESEGVNDELRHYIHGAYSI